MGIKYNDTIEGWNARGYKVTRGSKSMSKNREGKALFSWGQVVPYAYRDYSDDYDSYDLEMMEDMEDGQ